VHPNADRVETAMREAGAEVEVRELDESTRTAADAAAALGVPVGAIVKSLVFTADADAVLVLASGDHQVDTAAVARSLGAATVERASPDVVRRATGYAIGGVAPVAHPAPLRTVLDRHLATYDVLWAAAGTPRAVFRTTYADLARVTGAVEADVGAG
jgi:prolyl-tRNA editing enzyme YbaK/EbsC (Cys-tRNA(Pro) deacylase)